MTWFTPAEHLELDARRATLQARAEDLAEQLGACGNLRALVRENLAGIQQVRAVEVGLVLLTSHPPRMPVTFATALTSGRVVRDRLIVAVPVRPRIVPLGGVGGRAAVFACPAAHP